MHSGSPGLSRSDRRDRTSVRRRRVREPTRSTVQQTAGSRCDTSSEGLAELDEEMETLFAPAGDIDSEEHRSVGVESEPDAVGAEQIGEAEVAQTRGHRPEVGEQRHIESGERFPPILGVAGEHVSVSIPVITDASKRITSAERRLEIERYFLTGRGCRGHEPGAQGDHPLLVENWNELLKIDVHALEREAVQIGVAV